ncbi:MAG: CHASE3 domain-containing protein [Actinomycetota bacterium]
MPLALEKKLPVILLLAFLMLAAIGFFSYQSTHSLQEAVKWQKHTQDVLIKLDDTLISAINIETGGRGFVISGTDKFLEPFNSGKQNALKSIEDLKYLTADNQVQTENLVQLEKLLNDKIAITEFYIESRRTDGLLGGVNEASKGEGFVIMNNIRLTVEKMKNEEDRLLKFRSESLQTTLNTNFWLMLLSSCAGIAALTAANFVVLFEIKKRRLAETDLVQANQSLEKRVDERTGELKQVNLELLEYAGVKERLLRNEQTARREAETANRLRDEFMAAISHELRTPLNSILGWARIIKSGKTDENTHAKAIDTIVKNAETQNRLIEDLMDVSRLISGKIILEIEEVSAEELVAASIATVKPSADAKSISLTLNVYENVKGKCISGDPNRLKQIVWNLLTNAIKFTPEGGKIEVGLTEENNQILVKVSDNGAGISREFLPFVFERFRQDAANIQKSGGLGLGLAIVRHLTEIHDGSVSVESEGKDKGSAFTVKFPVINEKAES